MHVVYPEQCDHHRESVEAWELELGERLQDGLSIIRGHSSEAFSTTGRISHFQAPGSLEAQDTNKEKVDKNAWYEEGIPSALQYFDDTEISSRELH